MLCRAQEGPTTGMTAKGECSRRSQGPGVLECVEARKRRRRGQQSPESSGGPEEVREVPPRQSVLGREGYSHFYLVALHVNSLGTSDLPCYG
jgi:hypothetical protein